MSSCAASRSAITACSDMLPSHPARLSEIVEERMF